MFALKKILNGRINVSEPISMVSGVTAQTTFHEGDAVTFVNGVLTKASGDVTADYVVAKETKCQTATDEVLLLLVTKEMLFDVEMATTVLVGKQYKFGTGASAGVAITSEAVANNFGAYIMRYDSINKVATVRLA